MFLFVFMLLSVSGHHDTGLKTQGMSMLKFTKAAALSHSEVVWLLLPLH